MIIVWRLRLLASQGCYRAMYMYTVSTLFALGLTISFLFVGTIVAERGNLTQMTVHFS